MEGTKGLPRVSFYKKLPGYCMVMMFFGFCTEIVLVGTRYYFDDTPKVTSSDINNR